MPLLPTAIACTQCKTDKDATMQFEVLELLLCLYAVLLCNVSS